ALQAVLGGGLPLHLVGQLVLQEPRLLDAPLDAMARRFQAVAASFGSFSDDAVDMVLADPSSLLPVPTPAWDSNSAPATGAQPSTDVNEDEVEDLKEEFQARLGAADRTIASLQDDKSKLQASLAAALAGGSHQGAQLQALQAT
ncbi:uncharacterized protein HaLaN_01237, partial [Haematococcus lacustris]